MANGVNTTDHQKRFIYQHYQEYTAEQMALHLELSRETIWKYLRKKELKCKRVYIKRKPIVLDRALVAAVLNQFANNGYSIKLAALSIGISYQKASWYIKHYYTRKTLSESTEVITKQSKV